MPDRGNGSTAIDQCNQADEGLIDLEIKPRTEASRTTSHTAFMVASIPGQNTRMVRASPSSSASPREPLATVLIRSTNSVGPPISVKISACGDHNHSDQHIEHELAAEQAPQGAPLQSCEVIKLAEPFKGDPCPTH